MKRHQLEMLLSFWVSRLAKSDAFPGPVPFDELDAGGFKRSSDLLYGLSSPT
jgi:hypothetical protein